MWYVYIIKSRNQDWRYVGSTGNLKVRLKQHNAGQSLAIKAYAPFELVAYVAVKEEQTARKLERYFKTGSGIAWMNRHLMPK